MSTLELTILITFSLLLISLNSLASLRVMRVLKRYSIPFLTVIWVVPLIGAVFVLAKIRPHQKSVFTAFSSTTHGFDINPRTIQGDPWPTISQPATIQNLFKQ